MGNQCDNCSTCNDQIYDVMTGDGHLQTYQKHAIKNKTLSRYDQFYRIVGIPFIEMNVETFFGDLDLLENYYHKVKKESGLIGTLDEIPYVMFLEYFNKKPFWEM